MSLPVDNLFIKVLDSRMHYLAAGVEGDPIVFIHGIPSSSYMWRNVMPSVAEYGHCIAPDLIGLGQSDKPDIAYTVFDHIRYFDAFMEALELKNVTLIMHAWGSVIGFDYAKRHANNVKGLVFLESHLRPVEQPDLLSNLLVKELKAEDGGYKAIMEQNLYIEKVLPNSVIRPLTDEEMAEYRKPFTTVKSRQPIWQYLQDLSSIEQNTNLRALMIAYSEWLQETEIPKLMLYGMPGFNTNIGTVMWAEDHLPKLTVVEIPNALHYAPESQSQAVAEAIIDWYQ